MSEKNKLAEKLLYAPKNGYDRLSAEDEKAMEAYCEDYKKFLNNGKTERLCVEYCIELAEKKGFKAYEAGMKLSAGDKVYFNNRGKGIMLAVIGSEDLSHGANIGAAHTDSPRLDLKPRPLYEEAEMAYFKTHHYGGIRKYQWVTIPLELHGVVVLRDGSKVDVHIGGKEDDPQFIINDLLPHLGREQGKKPLNEAIPSESLNVLLGGKPFEDKDCSDRFKLGVLQYLNVQPGSACSPITAAASRQGWKLKLATCRRTAMTRKDCVLNCWKTAGEPASSTTMESFCRRREEKSRAPVIISGQGWKRSAEDRNCPTTTGTNSSVRRLLPADMEMF